MRTWMQAFDENEWHFASVFDSRNDLDSWDLPRSLSSLKAGAAQNTPAEMPEDSEPEMQDKSGWDFDPFPEPRTMPAHWDLTELL